MPYKKSELIGGGGGSYFSDDLTQVARIKSVIIRAASRVDSIHTVWIMTDGTTLTGVRHGGGGGIDNVIEFKEGEYITSIKGRAGSRIDSLTITTNISTYGPYGGNGGNPFGPIPTPKAGGFFGRSESELDAIGVFIPV